MLYLFGVAVVPLDLALALAGGVLFHFHLGADLLTPLRVDRREVTEQNLK